MDLDYSAAIGLISQFVWPMGRIGGLLLTVPVFSSALIPGRIKIILLFVLSCVCAFMVPKELSFLHFKGVFLGYILQELLFGLLMGFVLQLVFQVFVLGGQIIAMQAGLSFAVMMDPASRASVPLVSQLYSMMMTLIFLALNGHLTVLKPCWKASKLCLWGRFQLPHLCYGMSFYFQGGCLNRRC